MSVMQNTVRISPVAALFSLAAARLQDAADRMKAKARENAVREELRSYTDRELADIGLSRSQVETMDLTGNA